MIRLILIFWLLASPVHAMEMIGFGASCATQSAVVTQDTQNNEDDIWASDTKRTKGQSFTVPSNMTLYSIIVRGAVDTGGSCNIDMRIGTSADLTSYTAQATQIACNVATYVEHEMVFPTRPTLSTSTTYYFGVKSDATAVGNAFYMSKQTTDPYANGQKYQDLTTTWNMETAVSGTDYYFKVKKCD